MMTAIRNRKIGVIAAGLGAVSFLTAVIMSPSGAQAACTTADFTTDGTFDLQGYLACLAAESGGTLPDTGSGVVQIVGIAVAFIVMGAAASFAPRRGGTTA